MELTNGDAVPTIMVACLDAWGNRTAPHQVRSFLHLSQCPLSQIVVIVPRADDRSDRLASSFVSIYGLHIYANSLQTSTALMGSTSYCSSTLPPSLPSFFLCFFPLSFLPISSIFHSIFTSSLPFVLTSLLPFLLPF